MGRFLRKIFSKRRAEKEFQNTVLFSLGKLNSSLEALTEFVEKAMDTCNKQAEREVTPRQVLDEYLNGRAEDA